MGVLPPHAMASGTARRPNASGLENFMLYVMPEGLVYE